MERKACVLLVNTKLRQCRSFIQIEVVLDKFTQSETSANTHLQREHTVTVFIQKDGETVVDAFFCNALPRLQMNV